MVSRQAALWNRGLRQLWNALFDGFKANIANRKGHVYVSFYNLLLYCVDIGGYLSYFFIWLATDE